MFQAVTGSDQHGPRNIRGIAGCFSKCGLEQRRRAAEG